LPAITDALIVPKHARPWGFLLYLELPARETIASDERFLLRLSTKFKRELAWESRKRVFR